MKTFSAKPTDIKRQWHILDASEIPLGRLATTTASLLIGKSKPIFTPHMDGGDFVIVINAKKLVVTGNKPLNKKYYRHSGFPGGLHKRSLVEQSELDPTKIVRLAVSGMLPPNKLKHPRLLRLKVYPAAEHSHSGQNPKKYEFKVGRSSNSQAKVDK